MSVDLIKELGALTLASRMKRLADRFQNDVGVVFRERHISLEPRWVTIYYLLARDGAMSVVEIARALHISHPAVHQVAQEMLKAGYLVQSRDQKDGRRRLLTLSDLALAVLPEMQKLWEDVERAAMLVIQESGYDVLSVLERLEWELDQKPFHQRIRDTAKGKQLEEVVIVEFQPEMAQVYRELVLDWVRTDYQVEPEDLRQAEDPVGTLIRPGGHVFMAKVQAECLGTAALRRVDEQTYELCKMVVTPRARGRQVGQRLMRHAIAKARMLGARKIVLETNHKAEAAIRLYRKNGFQHHPFPADHPPGYARADVWMELDLAT
ncbi:GNAT family N-acetyltransferase [bacterium]|nr:GNAT family N-acetyltransferase [bacterium]